MSNASVSLSCYPPIEKGHTSHAQILQLVPELLWEKERFLSLPPHLQMKNRDPRVKRLDAGHMCFKGRAQIGTKVSSQ